MFPLTFLLFVANQGTKISHYWLSVAGSTFPGEKFFSLCKDSGRAVLINGLGGHNSVDAGEPGNWTGLCDPVSGFNLMKCGPISCPIDSRMRMLISLF